ncbi:MAG: OpgC family protein [Candidatus Binataceae bacterium]
MSNARQRDLRLDFCRGLALIIIFIDHVPNNPLSNFTLRNFSFCDAAEVFVLISGMASYLAYGSRFDQHGFVTCAKAIGKRWIKIYFAHLVLFAAVAGFVVLASRFFYSADYVTSLKLDWLVRDPKHAAASALTLTYLPHLLDILPLYLVLLGVAPLFIMMVKRDYRVALAISGALYIATWMSGWNLNAGEGRGWYFDPFAWQFLYVLGMAVCHLSRNASHRPRWDKLCLSAAVGFLVFAFLTGWLANGVGIAHTAPVSYVWPADKTFLSPLRVVNVIALLYVFGYFVSPQAPWLKTGLADLFRSCGRHSLSVYGFGVVLSCAGYVIMSESQWNPLASLVVNSSGIALTILLALALDRRGAKVAAAGTPARMKAA